jgi:hypothetical protein
MHFFLYEIVARAVAFYLLVDTFRELWNGLAERKIRFWTASLLIWSPRIVDRDARPIAYWVEIGYRAIILMSCLVVTIVGWH